MSEPLALRGWPDTGLSARTPTLFAYPAPERTLIDTIAIIGPGALGCSLARWAAERGLRVALAGRDRDHVARKASAIEQHCSIIEGE